VLCLHRVPKTISTNRGSQFVTDFWEQLHTSLGTHGEAEFTGGGGGSGAHRWRGREEHRRWHSEERPRRGMIAKERLASQ
jgi:hypothetical protein